MMSISCRSFSTPVRRIVSAFGVSLEQIEVEAMAQPVAPRLKTMRRVLQFVGDGFRTIDPDVWVKPPSTNRVSVYFAACGT